MNQIKNKVFIESCKDCEIVLKSEIEFMVHESRNSHIYAKYVNRITHETKVQFRFKPVLEF